MAGRKIRGVADARRCLRAVKAARGMGLAAWARANGIDGRSLRAWSMNLERGSAAGTSPTVRRKRLPAVRMMELVPAPITGGARYTVRCGAYSLELDDATDDATLRRLLRAMREC